MAFRSKIVCRIKGTCVLLVLSLSEASVCYTRKQYRSWLTAGRRSKKELIKGYTLKYCSLPSFVSCWLSLRESTCLPFSDLQPLVCLPRKVPSRIMVLSANSYNSSSAFECWLLGHDSAILRLSDIEMNVEIIVLAADLSRVSTTFLIYKTLQQTPGRKNSCELCDRVQYSNCYLLSQRFCVHVTWTLGDPISFQVPEKDFFIFFFSMTF